MTAVTCDNPKSLHKKLHKRLPAWSRVCIALVTVLIISWGTISAVTWYQQDRPLREIEKAMKNGQNQLALKRVGQYLRAYPEDARGQCLKARILVQSGQLSEALRLFQRFGAAEITDLHAWARAHLVREEWSQALPVLERLLQLSPNDADALHAITACRSFMGKYREAFESANRLATRPGNEARAALQVGTLHKKLGNVHSAVEAWERALEYDSTMQKLQVSPSIFFRDLGRELLVDGKPERARDYLQRSLKLKESADCLAALGEAQQQLGDADGAVLSWKRAVEIGGTLREPRESLAQVALRAGNLEEARSWLEPILKAAKLSSSTTYLMQRICLAENDQESAQAWQERTVQLRQKEKRQGAINHALIDSPDSFWSRAIRSYQFAEEGNWHEAEAVAQTLLSESVQDPFVVQLMECVRSHGPLPSLDLLPIQQF